MFEDFDTHSNDSEEPGVYTAIPQAPISDNLPVIEGAGEGIDEDDVVSASEWAREKYRGITETIEKLPKVLSNVGKATKIALDNYKYFSGKDLSHLTDSVISLTMYGIGLIKGQEVSKVIENWWDYKLRHGGLGDSSRGTFSEAMGMGPQEQDVLREKCASYYDRQDFLDMAPGKTFEEKRLAIDHAVSAARAIKSLASSYVGGTEKHKLRRMVTTDQFMDDSKDKKYGKDGRAIIDITYMKYQEFRSKNDKGEEHVEAFLVPITFREVPEHIASMSEKEAVIRCLQERTTTRSPDPKNNNYDKADTVANNLLRQGGVNQNNIKDIHALYQQISLSDGVVYTRNPLTSQTREDRTRMDRFTNGFHAPVTLGIEADTMSDDFGSITIHANHKSLNGGGNHSLAKEVIKGLNEESDFSKVNVGVFNPDLGMAKQEGSEYMKFRSQVEEIMSLSLMPNEVHSSWTISNSTLEEFKVRQDHLYELAAEIKKTDPTFNFRATIPNLLAQGFLLDTQGRGNGQATMLSKGGKLGTAPMIMYDSDPRRQTPQQRGLYQAKQNYWNGDTNLESISSDVAVSFLNTANATYIEAQKMTQDGFSPSAILEATASRIDTQKISQLADVMHGVFSTETDRGPGSLLNKVDLQSSIMKPDDEDLEGKGYVEWFSSCNSNETVGDGSNNQIGAVGGIYTRDGLVLDIRSELIQYAPAIQEALDQNGVFEEGFSSGDLKKILASTMPTFEMGKKMLELGYTKEDSEYVVSLITETVKNQQEAYLNHIEGNIDFLLKLIQKGLEAKLQSMQANEKEQSSIREKESQSMVSRVLGRFGKKRRGDG